MKELAILGATASGKTALSLDIASKHNAVILSLDSLSLYKEIDIASAKPTKEERGEIIHFGIDEIYPNEHFSSALFFDLYKKAKLFANQNDKNLIIVGGTSFYLKSLCEGLSKFPQIDDTIKEKVKEILKDKQKAYDFIEKNDKEYAKKISSSDSYRIGKWYEIYLSSSKPATLYFQEHGKEPLVKDLKIFEISVDREELRKKIALRTKKMIKEGIVDEVFYLEKKYTREPKPLKAIGIKESLEYLDGKIDLGELEERITIATAQLAKRQTTFNKTQFKDIQRGDIEDVYKTAKKYLKD